MIAEYSDILASEGASPLQGSPFKYSVPRAHALLSRLRRCDLSCHHRNLRFTIGKMEKPACLDGHPQNRVDARQGQKAYLLCRFLSAEAERYTKLETHLIQIPALLGT